MAIIPVLYFNSEEVGAPVLNNAAGSLIGVLDACLINGFNSKNVTGIVVASNVATATASAHGYEVGKVVEIAGATPSGLNGRQRVTSVTANTFTFATTGISDQTATGTITAKRPGLGWTKQYSGTNKAMYKRSAVGATAMMLRVEDTNAAPAAADYARMVMVESATDVDTYTNPTPTAAFLSGGLFLPKGANNTTAKPWIVVGDERAFYIFTDSSNNPFSTTGCLRAAGFGDIVSYKAGDAYGCFIGGSTANATNQLFTTDVLTSATMSTSADLQLARTENGITLTQTAKPVVPVTTNALFGGTGQPAYPSPVDNGMVILKPVLLKTQNASFAHPVRGELPGVAAPLATIPTSLHKYELTGLTNFSGTLLVVCQGNATNTGAVLMDLTGPWR